MAKTKQQLLALFPDNVMGLIGANDARALINSMNVYGGLYGVSGVPQTLTTTPVLFNEWTTKEPTTLGVIISDELAGRVILGEGADGDYKVSLDINWECGSREKYDIMVYKNGSPWRIQTVCSSQQQDCAIGVIGGILPLIENDYLEVWIRSTSGTAQFILISGALTVHRLT